MSLYHRWHPRFGLRGSRPYEPPPGSPRICTGCFSIVWPAEAPPDLDARVVLEQARADRAVALKIAGGGIISEHDLRGCSPDFVKALLEGHLPEKRAALRKSLTAIVHGLCERQHTERRAV